MPVLEREKVPEAVKSAEEIVAPASEEEKRDLAQDAERGRKISSLIQHPGWTDILKPEFDRQLEVLTGGLLHEDDYKKIVRYQEAVNAISKLFGIINGFIKKGEIARKRLSMTSPS